MVDEEGRLQPGDAIRRIEDAGPSVTSSALADDDFTPTFLAQRDRLRLLAAAPRRRRREQPRRLRRRHARRAAPDRWQPVAPARPRRGHLPCLPRRARVLHARRCTTEAFNVGSTAENYRIRDVAGIVQDIVPGSRVALSGKVGPDLRNYRVNCDKFAERVGFETRWTVEPARGRDVRGFRALRPDARRADRSGDAAARRASSSCSAMLASTTSCAGWPSALLRSVPTSTDIQIRHFSVRAGTHGQSEEDDTEYDDQRRNPFKV